MRLLTSLVALIAALCFLMASCASGKEHITEKQDEITTAAVHQAKFLMGRKLKSFSDHDFIITHKKLIQHGISPDAKKHETLMPHAAGKGTWKEWVDEEGLVPNKSRFYFTMDYHFVRRRRPIHNKQLPFTP